MKSKVTHQTTPYHHHRLTSALTSVRLSMHARVGQTVGKKNPWSWVWGIYFNIYVL